MWKSIQKDRASIKLRGIKKDGSGDYQTHLSIDGHAYNADTRVVLELLMMAQMRAELEVDIQTLEAQMFETMQENFFRPELSKVYKERNDLKWERDPENTRAKVDPIDSAIPVEETKGKSNPSHDEEKKTWWKI